MSNRFSALCFCAATVKFKEPATKLLLPAPGDNHDFVMCRRMLRIEIDRDSRDIQVRQHCGAALFVSRLIIDHLHCSTCAARSLALAMRRLVKK